MARPFTFNKSNYFIFGGQYVIADDEFIKNTLLPDLPDERFNKLMFFVFTKTFWDPRF